MLELGGDKAVKPNERNRATLTRCQITSLIHCQRILISQILMQTNQDPSRTSVANVGAKRNGYLFRAPHHSLLTGNPPNPLTRLMTWCAISVASPCGQELLHVANALTCSLTKKFKLDGTM